MQDCKFKGIRGAGERARVRAGRRARAGRTRQSKGQDARKGTGPFGVMTGAVTMDGLQEQDKARSKERRAKTGQLQGQRQEHGAAASAGQEEGHAQPGANAHHGVGPQY